MGKQKAKINMHKEETLEKIDEMKEIISSIYEVGESSDVEITTKGLMSILHCHLDSVKSIRRVCEKHSITISSIKIDIVNFSCVDIQMGQYKKRISMEQSRNVIGVIEEWVREVQEIEALRQKISEDIGIEIDVTERYSFSDPFFNFTCNTKKFEMRISDLNKPVITIKISTPRRYGLAEIQYEAKSSISKSDYLSGKYPLRCHLQKLNLL